MDFYRIVIYLLKAHLEVSWYWKSDFQEILIVRTWAGLCHFLKHMIIDHEVRRINIDIVVIAKEQSLIFLGYLKI